MRRRRKTLTYLLNAVCCVEWVGWYVLWWLHRVELFALTVPLAAPQVTSGGFEIERHNSSSRNIIIYFKVGLQFVIRAVVCLSVCI